MGNWRTVMISGSVGPREVPQLIDALDLDRNGQGEPLCWASSLPGLLGLNAWVPLNGQISANGNLYERDFTLEAIEEHLTHLVAIAPSLDITLHAGGDNEDKTCVATFRVQNGAVERLPPQVAVVSGASEVQMHSVFTKYIGGGRLS